MKRMQAQVRTIRVSPSSSLAHLYYY